MDTKSLIIGVVITLLAVGAIGGGVYAVTTMDSTNESTDQPEPATEAPQETVSEDEVPEDVKNSVPAAKELKSSMTEEGYENTSVSVAQSGEIVVTFNSDASNGAEIKDDMTDVAYLYSDAVENETGGLTVAANGVKLMVSSDAAVAHSEDRLKDDAFEETFHWGSVQSSESDE